MPQIIIERADLVMTIRVLLVIFTMTCCSQEVWGNTVVPDLTWERPIRLYLARTASLVTNSRGEITPNSTSDLPLKQVFLAPERTNYKFLKQTSKMKILETSSKRIPTPWVLNLQGITRETVCSPCFLPKITITSLLPILIHLLVLWTRSHRWSQLRCLRPKKSKQGITYTKTIWTVLNLLSHMR